MHATWILLLLTWLAAPVDPPITPDRVVALFNGKDLSNWQPVDCSTYTKTAAASMRAHGQHDPVLGDSASPR